MTSALLSDPLARWTADGRLQPGLVRGTAVVGAIGLAGMALTVPLGGSESDGRQWDNVVLAAVVGWALWRGVPLTVVKTGRARLSARASGLGGLLLLLANLVAGIGGQGFGHGGAADVLLGLAAWGPLTVCALLASQTDHARWAVMAQDALVAVLGLMVVVSVFVATPARDSALPAAAADLVATYGYYTAIAVGAAAGLCTVAARGLRHAATAQMLSTLLFAAGASSLAMTVVTGSRWWELVADLSALAGVLMALVATAVTPDGPPASDAERAPQIVRLGYGVVFLALLGLPLALGATLLMHHTLTAAEVTGSIVVFLLLVARTTGEYLDHGRITDRLVSRDDDVRELVAAISDQVAIVGPAQEFVVVSPAARSLLGLAEQGTEDDRTLLDLVAEADRERVRAALTADGPTPQVVGFTVLAGPLETATQVEATVARREGSDRIVLNLRDVTRDHARAQELERLAFTDHLTGLPNRASLSIALDAPHRGDRSLLYLDLDGFKQVNDSTGHDAGDLVLVEVARRLQHLTRGGDVAARLGGDEFAVVVRGDTSAAIEVAQRLLDSLCAPYRIGDRTFPVGVSVGIAPLRRGRGRVALREADEALRAAKAAGKGCWRLHTDAAVEDVRSDVLTAIAQGQVQLRYDVLTDPTTGGAVGLQARPVWHRPSHGALPAGELWAAAERHGQQAEVRRWVLRRACEEVAPLPAHVGLSVQLPPDLAEADHLVTDVTTALGASGLAVGRLSLLFTEELLQNGSTALLPALHTLRDAGVRLVLTDYGLGATFYGHLTRVPLDAVAMSLRSLAVTGTPAHALRVLQAIVAAANQVGLGSMVTDVATPEALAEVSGLAVQAVSGPALQHDLDAETAARLVGTPSAAALPG